jgi:hypothetical protein
MYVSPPFALSVFKVIVLQKALASFVTNWTIDRVVYKQGFLDAGATFTNNLTVRNNNRPIFNGRLTSGYKLWDH